MDIVETEIEGTVYVQCYWKSIKMFKCTSGFMWTHSHPSLTCLKHFCITRLRDCIKAVQNYNQASAKGCFASLLSQVHVVLKCLLSSYALLHPDPLQHSPNNRIVCLNKPITAVSIFQSDLQAFRLWWQVLLLADTWHSFRGDWALKFNLRHFLIGLEGFLWMSQ